jgi:hypothetical protein
MNREVVERKEAMSVSEMARAVRLSRTRFYQLVRAGVFPPPSRDEQTGRPFYTREQQDACLAVRQRNCGINGRTVLFYSARSLTPCGRPARPAQRRKAAPERSTISPELSDLVHGLRQLGVEKARPEQVREALAMEFPSGRDGCDPGEVLRAVFRRLTCQDSHDNVAG